MSKELAGELFARVDMPHELYKQLKEEHEFRLLKVYNPQHKELYKEDALWSFMNEKCVHYLSERSEREAEIRIKHEMK